LSPAELQGLRWLWEFWAHPHQLPPEGNWRTWLILGGRGAGKTRAGSEWIRARVEGGRPGDPGRARRIALVGETYDSARQVMIDGESGIMACSPPDRRPEWVATRRALVWPNGAEALLFSAHDPEMLRGPQFDTVWADELAKWKKGQEAWDMLQFCLRLGDRPQSCVTTTPQRVGVLKGLLAQSTTVTTHATTKDNSAYLAADFIDEVYRRYGKDSLGRQELEGVLLDEPDGALWTHAMLDRAKAGAAAAGTPARIVVAVDPPAGSGARADTCGIIVAGLLAPSDAAPPQALVLEDASLQGASPTGWAKAAIAAFDRHGADRIVAEVNQGGAMVETILRQVRPHVSYTAVHASRSKVVRAEPIASLYEQGRVLHADRFEALEEQMIQVTRNGYLGPGSPDRVDALVWALTELMGSQNTGNPRARSM
jgi:phage terminase large subunit-like protein